MALCAFVRQRTCDHIAIVIGEVNRRSAIVIRAFVMPLNVVVRTVGLGAKLQSELNEILSGHPTTDIRHLPDWSFSLLTADVIILGTGMGVVQSTLEMLRNFATIKNPILVTYSEDDECSVALDPRSGTLTFSARLQKALNRAALRNGVDGYTLPASIGLPSDWLSHDRRYSAKNLLS